MLGDEGVSIRSGQQRKFLWRDLLGHSHLVLGWEVNGENIVSKGCKTWIMVIRWSSCS